jgi:hypothetical protein
MKLRLFFIAMLFSFFAVPFVHSETPTAVTGLTATIVLDKGDDGEYGPDHPIKLTYTLENSSTKNIYVLRWGTPLEGFMSNVLDVKTAEGAPIDYDGIFVSRVGPLPDDYVEIPAGKSLSVELPVHEGYKIQAKGNYTITLPRKMVLDTVHQKPAPGELTKRKFSPAAVQMAKTEVRFKQKEKRPLQPLRPGSKLPAPVMNTPPQHPVRPDSPASPLPQHPVMPGTPAAPDNLRQINEAPYPQHRYVGDSGFFRYAEYAAPPDIIKRYAGLDVVDRVEITDPEKQAKVMSAYRQAYKIAAESKVIMNAGDNTAGKAARFNAWFGPSFPVPAKDKPDSCREWINKLHLASSLLTDDLSFGDRYTTVRITFGAIYNSFFDNAPDSLVRFFQGPKSAKSVTEADKRYTEAIKAEWPCDYRSVVAYVYGWESRPVIFLCDSFFDPPQGYKIDQAGMIIHELSHKATVAVKVSDWAYESDECTAVALCLPDEAPQNADNYHLFAANPTNLGIGLTPGQSYAHFRTVGGYYLSAGTGGTLEATKDSSLCSNCTFVLEALGTTATAAPLKDGQTVRLLTLDRKNTVSAAGLLVQADSTSQKAFWIKKKGSGASTAEGEITTGDEIYLDPVSDGTRLNVTTGAGNKSEFFIIELAR